MGDGEAILLEDIWQIEKPKDFKVHFARWNGHYHPLNEWVSDRSRWVHWQHHRERNVFNRRYIFSLMDFYHERDAWLFGGVFRVLARRGYRYDVELTDLGGPFIGRLKLGSSYRARTAEVNFENHYDGKHTLHVLEILREPYSGRRFPGYERVAVSFGELEALVRNDRPDWKAALQSIKGVYLITDAKSGKHYVGSAYGDQGVWSRWGDYVNSGHGGNAELRAWLKERGRDYCRANSRFALLENHGFHTPDETILRREAWWKRALLTREFGLNRN